MRRLAAAVLVVAALAAACGDDDDDDAAPATTTTVATTTTTELSTRYLEPSFTDVDVTSDVEYGSAPGVDGAPESLLLDVYQPRGDDATGRAAIIFVHGGGFSVGDKTQGVSSILAPTFAKLGYVTVSANYRLLAPGGCTGANTDGGCSTAALEGIHDGQAAVRWLRDNAETYGVDPDRIAIAGESAGGVMSYGAGTWSDAPGDSGTPGVSSEVQAFMALSGGLPGGLFADAGDAPGIFFASTGDPVVPYSWSVDGRDKLVAAGVDAELVTYEGDVHVPFRDHAGDIIARTTAFFAEHLVASGS